MIVTTKEFNVLGDYRGQLVALEENRNIPFDLKRVFYIFLLISLALYYGALFNVKYLYLFSPRFNFIIAPIVYFYLS